MPNRETRRNGDSGLDTKIGITIAGETYEMTVGDFSALDEFDFYKTTGFTIIDAFTQGTFNTFVVAGLVWLHRRVHEKTLTFEEVARTLKFSDLETIEFDDGQGDVEPVEVANPEA